jgi:hypothetical protein
MLRSSVSLGTAQIARAASLTEQLEAPSPPREAVLEGVRQRNAFLDFLFYDVKCVRADEAARIGPRWAAEGAILAVPPSGEGPLSLHRSVDDFVVGSDRTISTLVVAGVGSSALGSAAFARNVADAIGQPVAAVVSGFGLADLMTEALGGFFWFGALNSMRHSFEWLDRLTRPPVVEEPALAQERGMGLVRQSLDTRTLLALLEHPALSFDLLAGHSKGNLVISEALYALAERNRARARALGSSASIVTFSARIAMPVEFRTVIDVMGEWDWFGDLNSRRFIRADRHVSKAWHHTNTELPWHLPVTPTLTDVLRGAAGRAVRP